VSYTSCMEYLKYPTSRSKPPSPSTRRCIVYYSYVLNVTTADINSWTKLASDTTWQYKIKSKSLIIPRHPGCCCLHRRHAPTFSDLPTSLYAVSLSTYVLGRYLKDTFLADLKFQEIVKIDSC
jgi:hypothetical protein